MVPVARGDVPGIPKLTSIGKTPPGQRACQLGLILAIPQLLEAPRPQLKTHQTVAAAPALSPHRRLNLSCLNLSCLRGRRCDRLL